MPEARRLTEAPPAAEALAEKRGNSVWVGCPACATAFPVSPVLTAHPTVKMTCPTCHQDFSLNR